VQCREIRLDMDVDEARFPLPDAYRNSHASTSLNCMRTDSDIVSSIIVNIVIIQSMVSEFSTDKKYCAGAYMAYIKSSQNDMVGELLTKKHKVSVASVGFL